LRKTSRAHTKFRLSPPVVCRPKGDFLYLLPKSRSTSEKPGKRKRNADKE
jgi:hypothetical protein